MTAAPSAVRAAIAEAAQRFAATSATARLDAELLMAHALGIDHGALLIDPDRYPLPGTFAALVERRAGHEPVAYIVGYRDFWTLRITVGPGVLIPRADSETLIEAALAHVADRSADLRILDLGTGPGTLLLAALSEWPAAQGLGIDLSATALEYARANAARLGLAERATFQTGDWAEALDGVFDIILCNPPYVESDAVLDPQVADHEPATALYAGADGLDAYRSIIPMLPPRLAPGGIAILEIGSTQRDAVSALARGCGLSTGSMRDLGGRDRAITCWRE